MLEVPINIADIRKCLALACKYKLHADSQIMSNLVLDLEEMFPGVSGFFQLNFSDAKQKQKLLVSLMKTNTFST